MPKPVLPLGLWITFLFSRFLFVFTLIGREKMIIIVTLGKASRLYKELYDKLCTSPVYNKAKVLWISCCDYYHCQYGKISQGQKLKCNIGNVLLFLVNVFALKSTLYDSNWPLDSLQLFLTMFSEYICIPLSIKPVSEIFKLIVFFNSILSI